MLDDIHCQFEGAKHTQIGHGKIYKSDGIIFTREKMACIRLYN